MCVRAAVAGPYRPDEPDEGRPELALERLDLERLGRLGRRRRAGHEGERSKEESLAARGLSCSLGLSWSWGAGLVIGPGRLPVRSTLFVSVDLSLFRCFDSF